MSHLVFHLFTLEIPIIGILGVHSPVWVQEALVAELQSGTGLCVSYRDAPAQPELSSWEQEPRSSPITMLADGTDTEHCS